MITLENASNQKQRELITSMQLVGIDITQEGVQIELEKLGQSPARRQATIAKTEERKIREAEGVLKWLRYPGSIIEQECNNCKRKFGTNYVYNKHCSEECLKESLAGMGLAWNPEKTDEERFGGEPPATISPDTLAKLKKWAAEVLIEPTNPPARVGNYERREIHYSRVVKPTLENLSEMGMAIMKERVKQADYEAFVEVLDNDIKTSLFELED